MKLVIFVVSGAALVLQETASVGRRSCIEEVRRSKTWSSRTTHLTSHFWSVLTHSAQWPWGCILIWGYLSVPKLPFSPLELQGPSMRQEDKGLTTSKIDTSYRTMQLCVLCNILSFWWITYFFSNKIMKKNSFLQWQIQFCYFCKLLIF